MLGLRLLMEKVMWFQGIAASLPNLSADFTS